MKKVNLFKTFALMALSMSFIFMTSCEEEEGTIEDISVVGLWTLSTSSTVVEINTLSMVDFLVNAGITQTVAQAQYDAILAEMDMTGTITLNEDGTFTTNWVGEDPDSGTWTISSDNQTLTIVDPSEEGGSPDIMIFKVLTLTSESLTIEMTKTEIDDLDDDSIDDTKVTTMTLSFTK